MMAVSPRSERACLFYESLPDCFSGAAVEAEVEDAMADCRFQNEWGDVPHANST